MKQKLKRRDVRILSEALSAMSGRVKAVEVDGKARLVSDPYDLTPTGRNAISRNSRYLRDEMETIQENLSDLVRKNTTDEAHPHGCDTISDEHPNWNTLQREQRDFLRGDVEVEIRQCAEADVKPDSNKLPGELVGMLWPMLSDWDRKPVAEA